MKMNLWIFLKHFPIFIFIFTKMLGKTCYDFFNKEVSVTTDIFSGKSTTFVFYRPWVWFYTLSAASKFRGTNGHYGCIISRHVTKWNCHMNGIYSVVWHLWMSFIQLIFYALKLYKVCLNILHCTVIEWFIKWSKLWFLKKL